MSGDIKKELTEEEKVFSIIKFFEESRWEDTTNQEMYCREGYKFDADDKILIHWLTYIMNRQKPYREICSIGSFVMSDIVYKFKHGKYEKGKGLIVDKILNITDGNFKECYKLKGKKIVKLDKDEEKNSFAFISESNITPQEKSKLEEYGYIFYEKDYIEKAKDYIENDYIKKAKDYNEEKEKLEQEKQRQLDIVEILDNQVFFKSRFYPQDYFCILNTLYILEKLEHRSITEYMNAIINNSKTDDIGKNLLVGLYLLTYDISSYGEKINAEYIENFWKNNEEYRKKILDKKYSEVIDFIDYLKNEKTGLTDEKIKKKYDSIFTNKRYDSKRIWCCLRDYFKSNTYKGYLQKCLSDESKEKMFDKYKKIKDDIYKQLELPGDVWNNNDKYRKCIFGNENTKGILTPYKNDKEKSWILAKILREKYKDNIKPIDFDITFNFVPRMCEENNCDICPFNKINENNEDHNNLEEICINNKDSYCTVALICCGTKIKCKKEKCELRKILKMKNK